MDQDLNIFGPRWLSEDRQSRGSTCLCGRSERSLAQKFTEYGDTLRGIITRDFPKPILDGSESGWHFGR